MREEEEAPARHAFESIDNLDMDILIVDDEEYVRNTIYYLFDKRGCRVTLAEDGEFGLTMAKQKPFDLVFMDYLMPKMGGVEAARKIHEHNKDVKIVFITGRDSLDEDELFKAGVYAFIRKPFEMKELFEIAKKVAMEKGLVE
jgi:CheY-like chemotaxis protein